HGGSENASADDEAESEAALAIVLLAVERVIWRAQKASQGSVVGSAAVNYIERREAGGDSNEKPFNAGQKGATMVKYSAVWASVMAYIWRTWHLEPVEEESAEGEAEEEVEEERGDGDRGANGQVEGSEPQGIRDRRPAYHFTAEQAEVFDRVRTVAYTAIYGRDGSDIHHDRDRGSGRDEDEDDTSELEGHVLDFFIALLDHDIGDNEFRNALYSGLAVLGIQPGHGWRSALVYTPVLSAIVTVARMLVLYKAKRARDEEIRRRQRFAGESKAKARERARSHFDRVREMVQRFMTIVAFDGQPSPMDSILRLRAYGKAIRANTNADGVVDWHGDELLIGHVQFSITSLRAMIHGLLHAARAQLRRAVLLLDVDEDGEPVTTAKQGAGEPAGATAWPAIQWDKLVDNAAETKAGWSFAEDPRNREAFGGVDGKRWLADRVEEEEGEEERAKAGGIGGKEVTRAGEGDEVQAIAGEIEGEEVASAGEVAGKGTGDNDVEVEAEIYRGRVQRRMRGQAERMRQAEESIEVEQFQAVLQEWSVGCTWCRAIGEAEEVCRRHTLDRCQEEDAGEIRRMVGQAERLVRWEPYSCCFDCGIPQAMCRRFEPMGPAGGFRRVEGQTCQYGGVLMRTVISIWGAGGVSGSKRLYEWMRMQGTGVDEDDIDGRIRWMGRKQEYGRNYRKIPGYRVRVMSRRDEGDRAVGRVVQAGLERYRSGKIIVYGGEVERVERLRDYAQASGRAGRDGEASEAVIVWPKGDDGHGAKRGKARKE
ncbi:hypothetical protein N657DRAFT_638369, partial [Parathielavia appendiculata]